MRHPGFKLDDLILDLIGIEEENLDLAIPKFYKGMTEEDLTIDEKEELEDRIFFCPSCQEWSFTEGGPFKSSDVCFHCQCCENLD